MILWVGKNIILGVNTTIHLIIIMGRCLKTKILLYQNDSFYIGQVNINNKKHGIGKLTYKDGTRYQGFWINDKFTGWGRIMETRVVPY